MRVWFDMTAPAHPVVFRPIIERMQAQGHEVRITARDYAQTLELLERMGLAFTPVGEHGGASRARKLASLLTRTRAVHRASGRTFDLAVAHGSNELALAAAWSRIPAVNMFDYEFAIQQHNIGCRLARRVLTPDAIPRGRLARFGAVGDKLVQFPGLKEEYYLWDFEPDPVVLRDLAIDEQRIVVIVRPPPDVSLYHRKANRLFPQVVQELGRREDVHAVILPRTAQQRRELTAQRLPSVVVAQHAVDAQSLIALADLVISAGGTMNREAVALGTPVYTTYGGRLGGVDEELIRQGRLRPLTDPRAVGLVKRSTGSVVHRRDPALLSDLMLEVGA